MRAPLLFLLAIIALAATLISCGDTEEVAPATVAPGSPTAASPKSPTPPPASTTPTPAPAPAGWKEYTDPVLGFSLALPADLVAADSGLSTSGGWTQRVVVFRSPAAPSRLGFTVAMVENVEGLTLQEWVVEHTACLPETIRKGTVVGKAAIFCTALPEEIPEATVLFENSGTVFHLSSIMPRSEFDSVIASLRL